MQKNTKPNWQKQLIVAALTTVFLIFTGPSEVVAQTEIQFNVLYECPRSPHNFKVLSCPNEKYCEALGVNQYTPSASYKFEINITTLINVFKDGGCKVDGKPLEWGKITAAPENQPPGKEPQAAEIKPAQTGRFKVGDRVLASPAMMKEDKYYQPCTVIKEMKPNAYYLMCDPHNGISFQDFTVREDFVRAWDNATPAPKMECLFNEPTGIVSKTAPASAALFKRIIYEKQAAANHKTKVGVTFETFQMGKPYKNIISGRRLLHEFLPQNTTIYPIKTRFVTCVQGREFNSRVMLDTCYDCAKDKFGEWTCGPACGAPKFLERHSIPNLSHFFGNQ